MKGASSDVWPAGAKNPAGAAITITITYYYYHYHYHLLLLSLSLALTRRFSAPTIAFLVFDWLKNSDYEPIVGVLRHMENSTPSFLFPDALKNCGNKNQRQNPV